MRIIEYKSTESQMKWIITIYKDYSIIRFEPPLDMPIVIPIPMKILEKINKKGEKR